jgi:dTDP-D-glucose 4,6-dehydratase
VHDLESGLRDTLDWYLSNNRWWQALLGRDYAAWLEANYNRQ